MLYLLFELCLDPPSAPKNLTVKESSKDYVILSWEIPETDGGSAILQYIVEKCDVTRGIGMWMVAGTASAADREFKVMKLLQGNAYLFRVSAENRVGPGSPAETTKPIIAQLPFGELGLCS